MSKSYGKPDRIVVALGGNALGNNPVEQIEAVSNTAHALLGLCLLYTSDAADDRDSV